VLVSRLLEAGEVVDLDGARPLRLRIGNVRGAELVYQGQRIDIASRARENVATVELP
jgi:cytoskeleton protein RodZ